MRGKRDRAKRTRTGPSKNLGNVCELFAREREKERGKERGNVPSPAGASSSSNHDQ